MNCERITALDGIRGLAILGVVLGHGICPIETSSSWAHAFKALISLGGYGVDIFFVLSGFLITSILLKNINASNLLLVFWLRRIARISPLYILFLLLMYALCSIFFVENLPSVPFWSYFFYLQNFFLVSGYKANHLGFDITWSLAIEEYFYAFFPLVLILIPRKKILCYMIILVVLGIPFRHIIHPFLEEKYGWQGLNFLMLSGRIDQLGLGAMLATFVVLKKTLLTQWIRQSHVIFFSLIVAILYFFQVRDQILPALVGFFLIGFALNHPKGFLLCMLELRALRFLGRISYALYLIHTPLFWFAHSCTSGASEFLAVMGAAVVAVALATVSTKFFEEPIQRMARKVNYSS